MLIVTKFRSDRELEEWLANEEENVKKLKKKYDPKKYTATLNLEYKRIEIKERK